MLGNAQMGGGGLDSLFGGSEIKMPLEIILSKAEV